MSNGSVSSSRVAASLRKIDRDASNLMAADSMANLGFRDSQSEVVEDSKDRKS